MTDAEVAELVADKARLEELRPQLPTLWREGRLVGSDTLREYQQVRERVILAEQELHGVSSELAEWREQCRL